MQAALWNLCLWPGLPGLWQRGQTRSLGIAVAFSVLVNATIWATVWRPAGVSNGFLAFAWAQVIVAWLISAWNSHRQLRRFWALPKSQQLDEWFREAQKDYLKGHWIEAEARLRRILEFAPADVESRLLLTSVYRRSGRADEALEQLRELALRPAAERWRAEREQEARRLGMNAPASA